MYLNNTVDSFIDFSASEWSNKIQISSFKRPETPNFMISWFSNLSPSPKTNIIHLWIDQDTSKKSGKVWENIGKYYLWKYETQFFRENGTCVHPTFLNLRNLEI